MVNRGILGRTLRGFLHKNANFYCREYFAKAKLSAKLASLQTADSRFLSNVSHLGKNVSHKKRTVVVAMSGGVDSSVAAYRLIQEGYNVFGVHMKNWDTAEELGSSCNADREWQDVQRVCRHLRIKCRQVNFVKQYWNCVFTEMLDAYAKGWTPNPDIACNREIKFGALYQMIFGEVAKEGRASLLPFQGQIDFLATGHYAKRNQDGELCRANDLHKDQSYFLCAVPRAHLRRCLFPLAELTKTEVRRIAAEEMQLPFLLERPESAGVCFIGRRNRFQEFLQEYLEPNPGPFVDVDSGNVLGEHAGIYSRTIGQKALVLQSRKYYVVGKDTERNVLFVTDNFHHGGFFSPRCWIRIHETHAQREILRRSLKNASHAVVRYQGESVPCAARVDSASVDGSLQIDFKVPVRSLAPGQTVALYNGNICVASGTVLGASTLDPRIHHGYYKQNELIQNSLPSKMTAPMIEELCKEIPHMHPRDVICAIAAAAEWNDSEYDRALVDSQEVKPIRWNLEALRCGVQFGNAEVLRCLLQHPQIDLSERDQFVAKLVMVSEKRELYCLLKDQPNIYPELKGVVAELAQISEHLTEPYNRTNVYLGLLFGEIKDGNPEIFRMLLREPRIYFENPDFKKIARGAVFWTENVEFLRVLLETSRFLSYDFENVVPAAILKGRTDALRILFDDPRIGREFPRRSALRLAANYKNEETVQVLLDRGFYEALEEWESDAIIATAAQMGHCKVVNTFLRYRHFRLGTFGFNSIRDQCNPKLLSICLARNRTMDACTLVVFERYLDRKLNDAEIAKTAGTTYREVQQHLDVHWNAFVQSIAILQAQAREYLYAPGGISWKRLRAKYKAN